MRILTLCLISLCDLLSIVIIICSKILGMVLVVIVAPVMVVVEVAPSFAATVYDVASGSPGVVLPSDVTEQEDANNNDENPIVGKDDPKNITIKQGEQFAIQLESNPTTGYEWIPEFNDSIINLTSHSFESWQPGMPGASGNDTFAFDGLSHGQTNLEFTYKRSWEKEIVD
jgi:inhibitor of cysteine peptidase